MTVRAPRTSGARRGVALPAAVIALAIVSLFIAGSAFFAMQEMRASANAVHERGALEAAEYGAAAVMRDWDPSWNTSIAVGTTLGPFSFTMSDGSTSSARTTRTSLTTFWVVSDGASGAAGPRSLARRSVNAVYRLDLPDFPVSAALTVRDSAEVLASGVVSGNDTTGVAAAGGACSRVSPAVAGVAAPDTARVCDGGCGSPAGNVRGTPPMLPDPFAGDSLRYLTLGGRGWQSLTAAADIVLPPNATVTPAPVGSAGACMRGLPDNWGDPFGSSSCVTFFPVIWARGDVTIAGGVGQGILLVEGDLRLGAGANFSGVVIARDDIITTAGGGSIFGAAMAADSRRGAGDHTIVGASGMIRYSACAVQRALLGAAMPRRVRQRAWAEFH